MTNWKVFTVTLPSPQKVTSDNYCKTTAPRKCGYNYCPQRKGGGLCQRLRKFRNWRKLPLKGKTMGFGKMDAKRPSLAQGGGVERRKWMVVQDEQWKCLVEGCPFFFSARDGKDLPPVMAKFPFFFFSASVEKKKNEGINFAKDLESWTKKQKTKFEKDIQNKR